MQIIPLITPSFMRQIALTRNFMLCDKRDDIFSVLKNVLLNIILSRLLYHSVFLNLLFLFSVIPVADGKFPG